MATPDSLPHVSPAEVYAALEEWLENCLELLGEGKLGSASVELNTIAEGNIIADCLQQLAPDFFNRSWRTKIIPEASASWRLKASNLKKILKSMEEYYLQHLHISLSKFPMPDIQSIAEHNNKEQTGRLLQLLLGIAVHCNEKEKYIQGIMSLQETVQHTVMAVIQELMSLETASMVPFDTYQELEEQYHKALEEQKSLRTENESLLQQNHELHSRTEEMTSRLVDLTAENERLQQFAQEPDLGTPGGVKLERVHRKLKDMRLEKVHIEAERDELQAEVGELRERVSDLEQKNHQLSGDNAEIPQLRDQLEEMRYLEGKVKSYESALSQYKKKIEDLQDLRRQMRALEDKNMMYMQQNLDLEEELRRLSSVRQQLDSQKKQISSLENDLAEERFQLLQTSQELEEKTTLVQTLNLEVKDLRHQLELPSSSPIMPKHGPLAEELFPTASPLESDSGSSLMEAYTPELKEKMIRLEKENEILHKRLTTAAAATESQVPNGSEGDEALKRQLAEKNVRIEQLEREVMKRVQELTSLAEFKANYDQIKSYMKAKEQEVEKYKKYLNKAKKIIESFGEKKSDAAAESAEIQQLRAMVKEKEREADRIAKAFEQDKQIREKEERLILSAWYNLGLKFHQQVSKERLSSQVSFLSQQRHAALKKPLVTNSALGNRD